MSSHFLLPGLIRTEVIPIQAAVLAHHEPLVQLSEALGYRDLTLYTNGQDEVQVP